MPEIFKKNAEGDDFGGGLKCPQQQRTVENIRKSSFPNTRL
jgi:hypothetical protein